VRIPVWFLIVTVALEDPEKNNWCSIQSCVACAWILISPIRHFQNLIMGMDSVLNGALSGPSVLAFSLLQHPAVAAETPLAGSISISICISFGRKHLLRCSFGRKMA
jgi:hypothetical protein